MLYFKQYMGELKWKEITREEALDTILGSYKDNEEVRSFLDTPGEYPCMFSFIRVEKDN